MSYSVSQLKNVIGLTDVICMFSYAVTAFVFGQEYLFSKIATRTTAVSTCGVKNSHFLPIFLFNSTSRFGAKTNFLYSKQLRVRVAAESMMKESLPYISANSVTYRKWE